MSWQRTNESRYWEEPHSLNHHKGIVHCYTHGHSIHYYIDLYSDRVLDNTEMGQKCRR